MRGVWSVAAVRAAEEALMARLPEGALMQRAAAGLATVVTAGLPAVYGARVTLLVGAGNNGGDALYAGARLAKRGVRVTAHLLSPEHTHGGGLIALRAAGGRIAPATPGAVDKADVVVDGVVGIGGRGGLRPPAAALVEAAAARSTLTVAVDIPSGVDADTGSVDGTAVWADLTVTFGCLKPGLVAGAGAEHAGEVTVIDIGLDQLLVPPTCHMLTDDDVAGLVPTPDAASDKYTRGVLGIVAGSPAYGGAAVLAVGAALRTGTGMVRYAGRAAAAVRARWPEVVVSDGAPSDAGRVQAWVVGPGLGTDAAAGAELADVLASDVPVLVDADALTLLGREPSLVRDRHAPTLLTPHDREFERVAGPVGADRIAAARRAAAELGVTVLLKGNATVVAAADGTAYVNPTGTPWLATAGSGDVLSGCAGALLASGLDTPVAGAAAAYLHGRAGQIAARAESVTAVDVSEAMGEALRTLRRPPVRGTRAGG